MIITVDSALYYTEEFIQELIESGQKNVVIIDSSLSDSALQAPRSIHIGSRQSRSLPSSLILAQRLKQQGISLKIYYLAIDNTMHFNQRDKRNKDNRISKARLDYILDFTGIPLDDDQFEAVYINPRYRQKEGDIIEADLPVVRTSKGTVLALTGENAVILRKLQQKLVKHKTRGEYIIGMTAHSGGKNLQTLADYLGVSLIGACQASSVYGTKSGNKALFEDAQVPHVYGSNVAQKDYLLLIDDCCDVAEKTRCKKLIIKLNSSSAGRGNLEVDISACYGLSGWPDNKKIRQRVYEALVSHRHPEKDNDILPHVETFYMRKLRELGAIVEAKLEGHDIVSPGSIAVVDSDGQVTVEYIYDQVLLGTQGQDFGGSMGPSELSSSNINWMRKLTQHVGEKYAALGGRGYFGLDFLFGSDIEPVVIEGNLRKTGTKYPWIVLLLLLGQEQLDAKILFHDDNIPLPIGLDDITGRQASMNHFMDCFHQWISIQDVHFNLESKTGAIITFDTHTSGKLGVLFVGDDRAEVRLQRQRFVELLTLFSFDAYPNTYLPRQYAGVELAKTAITFIPESLDPKDVQNPSAKMASTVAKQSLSPISYNLYKFRRCASLTHGSVQQLFRESPGEKDKKSGQGRSMTLTHDTAGLMFRPNNSNYPTTQSMSHHNNSRTTHNKKTSVISGFFPKERWDQFRKKMRDPVFVILGKTKTSDELLIDAVQNGLKAYRMNEVSEYYFDENTRCGYVTNVTVPRIDPRTGRWKMVFDDKQMFPLPTVVYDYDFTERRQKMQQTRGDRTILDKTQKIRAFFDLINVVYFNKSKTNKQNFIAPTQSPIALMQALKNHAPHIYYRCPKIITCNSSDSGHKSITAFIKQHTQFYAKPAMVQRNKNPHLGTIYIEKIHQEHGTQLRFSYLVQSKDSTHAFKAKQYTLPLSACSGEVITNTLNKIKSEIGISQDNQYLLQEALNTAQVNDAAGRSLCAKLRIVTLHDPKNSKIIVSGSYGLYGGKNAYLGYVGSLSVYICAFRKQFPDCAALSNQAILNYVFKTAIDTHRAVEQSTGNRQGEMITDIILSPAGPIPMKTHSKPERPDLAQVSKQTHFGEILEDSQDQRDAFIDALKKNEKERKKRIIQEAWRLHHKEFVPKEQTLRKKVDSMQYLNSGTMVASSTGPKIKG